MPSQEDAFARKLSSPADWHGTSCHPEQQQQQGLAVLAGPCPCDNSPLATTEPSTHPFALLPTWVLSFIFRMYSLRVACMDPMYSVCILPPLPHLTSLECSFHVLLPLLLCLLFLVFILNNSLSPVNATHKCMCGGYPWKYGQPTRGNTSKENF